MRASTRKGVSPVIATIMMVVITIVLSAVVVVMVMSFNSSGSGAHYGSFTMVEKNADDKYTLYFGTFSPQTRFSQVALSIAGQLTGSLSSYPSTSPFSSAQVASLYIVDVGGEGFINVGDTLSIRFNANMAGKVVDMLIVLTADGNVITGTTIIVGANPTPPPIAADYTYSSISGGKATISSYNGTGGAITIPSTCLGGYYNGAVITISVPVKAIGGGAFNNAQGHLVTSMIIPNSVTSIGNSAFQGCTMMTSVTIPDSVLSIGNRAFYACAALTSLNLGSSVTSMGGQAFQGCTALTSLNLGSSVRTIGNNAFQSCTALTSVTIPNSVNFIDSNAFYSCKALTAVTIGTGVTVINDSVFYGCSSLTSITFLGNVKPTTVGYWIGSTPASIRGHAYATSDFPAPWTTTGDPTFNGLKMGTRIA